MGSFQVLVIGGPTQVDLARINRAVDRAAMYSVREAGRQVGAQARKRAPVKTGQLKKSIGSARRLRKDGDTFINSVNAGRRGYPVARFYAKSREAATPYMRPAYDAVGSGQMEDISAKAYARAIATKGIA